MASTSEIFSDVSSEVDTCSARLSAVETEADVSQPRLDCNGRHSTRLFTDTYGDTDPALV